MNDGGFVLVKPPKYQSYSFDLAKAPEIYEKLVRAKFRDWVQDLIVKGKLLLDKPQASMMVDTNPFPEAPINTINLIWVEKSGSSFIAKEEGDRSHVTPIPPMSTIIALEEGPSDHDQVLKLVLVGETEKKIKMGQGVARIYNMGFFSAMSKASRGKTHVHSDKKKGYK
ncbi:hypothetical protein ACFX1R_031490 [Malus domestica]